MTHDPAANSDAEFYLYGFMDADDAREVAAADPSGRLALLTVGGVSAVCEVVSPDSVAAAGSDEDRLLTLARRHDRVVSLLSAASPTMPVRMGTLCTRPALTSAISNAHSDILGQLATLRGRHEWRLRVTDSPAPGGARSSGRRTCGTYPAESGTDYLHRRLASRRAAAPEAPSAESAFAELDRVLVDFSVATDDLAKGTWRCGWMRSYLIDDDRVERLKASVAPTLDRATRHGELLTLAGPLPAYSFVDLRIGVTT